MCHTVDDVLLRCVLNIIEVSICRGKETDILKEQIDKLNVAIAKEEERAHDLETKARYAARAVPRSHLPCDWLLK